MSINFKRYLQILIFPSLLLLGIEAKCLDNKSAYQIEGYFGIAGMFYVELNNSMKSATDLDSKGILSEFNKEEYTNNVVVLMNSLLNKNEISEVLNFIGSPPGKANENILKNFTSISKSNFENSSVSKKDQAAMESFMSRGAGVKVMNFLNSKELHELNISYTDLLACRYFSKNKPDEFEKLRKGNVCQNI